MREEGEGYGNGAGDEKEKKKKRVHVSLRWKQGNMESNLSQHPEIVPVDKLISLNINAECFIPWRRGPGAPSRNAGKISPKSSDLTTKENSNRLP